MIGRRVRHFNGHHELMSGEYGRWQDIWWAVSPNGHCANLGGYDVTEHPDGTITVSPSIEVKSSREGQPFVVYRGYLERGVWRDA